MKDFIKLREMIEELNSSNKTNEKKRVLAKYPECKKLLYYTYNKDIRFGVTTKNIEKLKDVKVDFIPYGDFYSLLDALVDRDITGHKAIVTVRDFCDRYIEYKDLIYLVLDRNLKCRINAKLINKVFFDLIPVFPIQLGYPHKKYIDKVDFEKEVWFWSRKLDGVRCVVFKKGEEVRFFSREGKEFHTLSTLIAPIQALNIKDVVLDGEVCIIDSDGNEDFTAIVSEVKRKNHTIENPKFFIFDLLTVEEFENDNSNTLFSQRYANLRELVPNNEFMEVLEQSFVKSKEHIEEVRTIGRESLWEGLILKKDTVYQAKKCKDILKVKDFEEDEFIVKGTINGPIRYTAYDENGVAFEKEEEMMSKAVVEYKGYEVGVGSGWKMHERQSFYKDPSKIIGKTITVKYFHESNNKDGGESLRFPSVKIIHGMERVL